MLTYIVGKTEGSVQAPRPVQGPRFPNAERNFAAEMEAAIEQVDSLQEDADRAVQQVASGKDVNLHGMTLSLEKADVALRTMVTVRNKVVDAYQQVMNMSI